MGARRAISVWVVLIVCVPSVSALALPPTILDTDLSTDAGRARAGGFVLPSTPLTLELWFEGGATQERSWELISTRGREEASPGWTIGASATGSWTWSLHQGESSLEYAPTAARQPMFDGRSHQLALALIPERREARLYHDGRCVAVYAINGLEASAVGRALRVGDRLPGSAGRLRVWGVALEDEEIAALHAEGTGIAPHRDPPLPDELRVMTWNIWHGGRENGSESGVAQVIDIIRASGADIVCVQETYGSGPRIADALDFHFFLRSSNLSIMSRYPIRGTHDMYRPFNLGGARIDVGGRAIDVFSLWLYYLPDISEFSRRAEIPPEAFLGEEAKTRQREIRDILDAMGPLLASSPAMILAGDFNTASHLDWTEAAARLHHDRVVAWPVTRACEEAGFIDTFRRVHPDPLRDRGLTWSPRFGDDSRIDLVLSRAPWLTPIASRVINTHVVEGVERRFPSDHAAVVTTFRVEPAQADADATP